MRVPVISDSYAVKARKKRDQKRKCLEGMLGKNSKEYREVVKRTKRNGERLRKKTKKRSQKKVKFL